MTLTPEMRLRFSFFKVFFSDLFKIYSFCNMCADTADVDDYRFDLAVMAKISPSNAASCPDVIIVAASDICCWLSLGY